MIPKDYEARIRAGEPIEELLKDRTDADKPQVDDAIMIFVEYTDLFGECIDSSKVKLHLVKAAPEYEKFIIETVMWESARRHGLKNRISGSDSNEANQFIGPTLDDGRRRFEILEQLGSGKRGAVYKAIDRGSPLAQQRVVAIRLFYNASTLDTLHAPFVDHQNVAVIHDVGIDFDPPTPYIVYEMLEGQTIKDMVLKKQPDLETILDIMIQLCDGVQAMHSNIVIHRDLKPENIFMVGDRPVISDFGSSISSHDDLIIAGSPMTMAPEQRSHTQDSTLVDIYGLGGIALFMFTGRYPNGGTKEEAIDRLANGLVVDLQGVPKSLLPILRKCLLKHACDRYESASALKIDLQAIRDLKPVSLQRVGFRAESKLFIQRHSAVMITLFAILTFVMVSGVAQIVSSYRELTKLKQQFHEVEHLRKISMNALINGMVEIRAEQDFRDPLIYLMLSDLGRGLEQDWTQNTDLFNKNGELLLRAEIEKYRSDPEFSRVKLAYWYIALARVQSVIFPEDSERINGSYSAARHLLIQELGDDDPLVLEVVEEMRTRSW